MTVIQKITAKGFKSFAKHTEMLFGDKFNVFIGPNGSGKSNVCDAICFVLGKASAKGLRAEKSANLIYNGGKKDKPSKFAEVSVVFDNKSKRFPVDSGFVKVSRVVNQKGNSVYKVNDKKMNRQQMIDLLRSADVDPDGHNIILQGDIVHFMEMKPVDRRMLIEDISGISVYDEKKNKALSELEKVEGKLTEANIILTEREANLKELKKDRDQAKKYLDLKSRIKDSKATYLNIKLKEKEKVKSEVEKRLGEQENKVGKIHDKIKILREAIDEKQEKIKEINYDLEEKGEREQKILRMEVSALRGDIIKHEERINTLNNEINKTKERIKQLKNGVLENGKKIRDIEVEKTKYSKKLREIKVGEEGSLEKLEGFKSKYGISSISDLNVKVDELDKKIESEQSLLNSALEAKQDFLREKDRLEFSLSGAEREIERLKGSKDSKKLEKFQKELESVSGNLNKKLSEFEVVNSNLNKNKDNFNSCSEGVAKLRAKSLGIQEFVSGNLAVKKVSGMKGVHGTISELGEVSGEHALALEVAAGPRLKSVVVDTDLVAAKCIKTLKESKLGVVSFLPLNKIKSRADSKSKFLKNKGVIGSALDLVSYKKKFAPAFKYVFGSTLVVDDLNTARKIGVGNARMVTLHGDLVEPSGAMIGGYRGRKAGIGFSQKEVVKGLKDLEEEQSKLKKLIETDNKKYLTLEKEINEFRERKSELSGEILKIEKSLGLDVDFSGLKKNVLNFKSEIKEVDSKLGEINKDVNSFEVKISKLREEKNEIRDKLNTDPKIKEGLERLESQINSFREESRDINSELKTLQNQADMYKDEEDKINKIISNHNKEIVNFKQELENLAGVVKSKKLSLKEKEKSENEFYTKFKGLAGVRNKLMNDIQKHEENVRKEEEKTESIRERINDISIKKAKVVAEMEGLRKEFEEFSDGKIRKGVGVEVLLKEIKDFEHMVQNIGNVNMRALEVYDELAKEHGVLLGKTNKLKSEKEDVLELINEIETKKSSVFMNTFNKINSKFKEIYDRIATKGEASLVLENKDEPLSEGVDINVRLGGNKFLDIRGLSGGEKTLAALSFIFAIQEHNPASFYLLDEVDAALDKKNSEKLSTLINQYAKNAQYIVISHNDSIISEANQVYGVSMQDGVSKITSLKL